MGHTVRYSTVIWRAMRGASDYLEGVWAENIWEGGRLENHREGEE